ncbi:unnamed protein product [Cylicocyclus nassatus]|uniref:Uncharacterized protein n=1 Tax=Cylicocyclus nassatus TaxID=53992 RepID=A0AA36H4S5_CYLNA|nr:unnamed protein product [Cylicocyclus nassatus]
MLLVLLLTTLFCNVSSLQCWTYNRLEIKGVDEEEHDYGLLTCRTSKEVCLTVRKTIQLDVGIDTIKIYSTGCGHMKFCLKGSCCRRDGCNKLLYAMLITDISAVPDMYDLEYRKGLNKSAGFSMFLIQSR